MLGCINRVDNKQAALLMACFSSSNAFLTYLTICCKVCGKNERQELQQKRRLKRLEEKVPQDELWQEWQKSM